VLSRLAATAITLPFLFALPDYIDAEKPGWNISLAALIAAIFLAAQFIAQRVARADQGGRLVAAFAVLYLVLGLLGFAGTRDYSFSQAVTDFILLYFIFLLSAAVSRYAAPVLGRAVPAILVTMLSIAAIVQAMHMQTFGFAIGPAGYRAIFQSSAAEALEFASHFLGAGSIAVAAGALAVIMVAALAAPAVRASGRALLWGVAWAGVAFPILGENAALVTARFEGFSEAVVYVEEVLEYRALLEARRSRPLDVSVTQEGPLAGKPQTYVFVIGESLTRNHMSLYGYWRETTPTLAGLASETAVFTDVVSPHSHTEQSLELVLTLANQSNGLRFTDASNYSLIEMLRAAGFATWWISNQNSFGPWDNKTAVLASGAERVHFTGTRSGRFVTGPLDEVLLEPFAAALQDPAPRKAIFLHFLGNHWDYTKRYPPQAAAFRELPTAGEIGAWRRQNPKNPKVHQVNDYDNAVRYHDQLAGRVIEMLRATGQAAVVTLFSDHGESLYEFKGHYWKQFTRHHVEVPLILWFSPEYARLAGEVVDQARAGARLPFALEDLPHLVADITQLRSAPLQRERSPLSAAYRAPGARPLFEGSLVYEESEEPLLSVRRALRRIAQAQPKLEGSLWAHRVNTLGKMMEVATLFSGAEIDVVYDAQAETLMVNHPPAPPSGLRLDELLGYANRLNPGLSLWLDVKNLDDANAGRVLEELNRLDARYAIRSRALVETGYTGPAAALLRQAGFRSSYYLPTAVVTQREGAGSAPASRCQGASEVRRVAESGRFEAVSYDWRGRQWVERCLGRFIRERGLRSYAWDLTPTLSDPRLHEALDEERLRDYTALAAVLLPFSSVFDDLR
jgi:heptose-I-phosphate ethanolaminephosphotransferase